MPKDNEVDEKVALWHMRTNPITGGVYMATDKPKGDPSYEYVRYDDHAATVAELRAEVERLRTALECVAWTREPGPIPSRVPGFVVEQMERIAINALTGADPT